MKIIVFGDIHGNLPALEVALREARAEGYDFLVHTGDLAGFAPYPEETITQIRDAGIAGVRGDVDDRIVEEAPALDARGADPAVVRFEERAYTWTLDHLHRAARRYLGNLPFEIRLDAGGRDTVLLHATPIDNSTCFWEDRDEDFFRDAVGHQDWYVRLSCVEVLGRAGRQEDLSLLAKLSADPSAAVAHRARVFLDPNRTGR